jgi:hypothetical protein
LREVLAEAPDLRQAVVELGYETGTDWTSRIICE